MSMSMDLPDVSEEEWRKYQARLFAEQTARATQSLTFRAAVAEPLMAQLMTEMARPAAPPPAPIPPAMPQPMAPPPSPFPATQSPLGAPMGDPGRQTGAAPDPSGLMRQLDAMEEGETPGQSAAPGQPAGNWFDGADPTKRSFFGQAQDTYQRAANDARSSGFSQTPIIGGALTGMAQGAADVMGNLSGSAQALREGDIAGGVMGAVGAPLNAASDVVRGMTTEMHVPDQIFSEIDPSTPVLGGLNSPREWGAIAADVAMPAMAVERLIGAGGKALWKGAKGPEAAKAFMRMAGQADQAMLGAATRGVDAIAGAGESLEAMGARMGGAESGIMTGPGNTRTYHGSSGTFDKFDPEGFRDDGLYGPGAYKTRDPEMAETYAKQNRSLRNKPRGTYDEYTADFLRSLDNDFNAPGITRDPLDEVVYSTAKEIFGDKKSIDEVYEAMQGQKWQQNPMGAKPVDDDWEKFQMAWNTVVDNIENRLYNGPLKTVDPTDASDTMQATERMLEVMRQDTLERFTAKSQPNIRPIDIAPGMRYLDIDNPLDIAETDLVRPAFDAFVRAEQNRPGAAMPADMDAHVNYQWAKMKQRMYDEREARWKGESDDPGVEGARDIKDYIGNDFYRGIQHYLMEDVGMHRAEAKKTTNQILSSADFAGVTHAGGTRYPRRGPDGKMIYHEVHVTFPDKMEAAFRNALSGTPGGIAETGAAGDNALQAAMRGGIGPGANLARTAEEFQADAALGAAGGVAGAATAGEDATWEERLQRGAMGAAAGALGGPAARGLMRDGSAVLGARSGGFDPERLGQRRGRANPLAPLEAYDAARAAGEPAPQRLPERERIADAAMDEPELEPVRDLFDETPELEPPSAPRPAVDALTAQSAREMADAQAAELARIERERVASGLPETEVKGPDLSKSMGRTAAEDVVGGPRAEGYPAEQLAFDMDDAGGSRAMLNPQPRANVREGAPRLPDAPRGTGQADVTVLGRVAAATAPGKPPMGTSFRQKLAQVFSGKAENDGDEVGGLLDPDALVAPNMTKRERDRLGHPNAMKAIPAETQDYAAEMRDVLLEEYRYMHGGRTTEESDLAAELLRPYILEVAANATPNMPANEAMMLAVRQAAADAALPAHLAFVRLQDALVRAPDDPATAVLRRHWEELEQNHNLFRLANEAISSEQGRAFRSQRRAAQSAPIAEGATSSVVQSKRDQEMEEILRLRSTTPGALEAADKIRAMFKKREADLKSGERTDRKWTEEEWLEIARMEKAKKWGVTDRRMGGPLEQYGFLWEDIVTREPGDIGEATLTLAEKMKYAIGLEELGGKVLRDKLYSDALAIDPRDGAQVRDFWLQAWNMSNRDAAASKPVRDMLQSRAKGAPEGKLVQRWTRVREDMMDFTGAQKELDDEALAAPRQTEEELDDLRSEIDDIRTRMTVLRRTNTSDDKMLHIQLEKTLQRKEDELVMAERGEVAGEVADPWDAPTTVREALPLRNPSQPAALTGKPEKLGASAMDIAEKHLRARVDFYKLKLEKVSGDGNSGEVKRYKDLIKRAQYDLQNPKGLLAEFEKNYPEPLRPGEVDTPERLQQKKEWVSKLDWKGQDNKGVLWTRRAISVTSSNMLSTMRMLENSIGEAAAVLVNIPGGYFFDKADGQAAKEFLRGAFGQDFGPAFRNAAQAFMTSSGPVESETLLRNVSARGTDLIRSDALTGKMAWAAPMHRGSNAISEFFSTLAYQGEMRVQALKAARGDTLSPGQIGIRVPAAGDVPDYLAKSAVKPRGRTMEDFLRAPTKEMKAAALKTAADVASGGPHSALAKTIGDLKAQLDLGDGYVERATGAAANILFPFVYGIDFSLRAGLNIIANPVKGTVKAVDALRRGDTDMAARQGAAAAMSASFLGYLSYLAVSGNATGGGPRDPNKREALLEATDEKGDPIWRPDSLRIPVVGPGGVRHVWVSYTSMPVISLPLNMMANGWEAFQFDGKKPDGKNPEKIEYFDTILRAGQAVTKALMQGSYMSGILELSNLAGGEQGQTPGRFVGELASRFVPASGLMRQAAYATDPYQKVSPSNDQGGFAGVPQQLAEGIPGLRNMVPNRVSPYTGKAVPTNDSIASLVAPGRVYAGASPVNRVAGEALARNEFPYGFTKMEQSEGADFAGSQQTGAAIRGAASEFGAASGTAALRLINSPEYQAMNPTQKAAALDRAFSQGKSMGQYQAEEKVSLTPEARVEHLQEGMPKYEGISGTPTEIASLNRRIGQARAMLSQLTAQYGPDAARMYLQRLSPENFQLAVSYNPIRPDTLWQQEQALRQQNAVAPTDFRTQGGGALGMFDLSTLPLPANLSPSQRARS